MIYGNIMITFTNYNKQNFCRCNLTVAKNWIQGEKTNNRWEADFVIFISNFKFPAPLNLQKKELNWFLSALNKRMQKALRHFLHMVFLQNEGEICKKQYRAIFFYWSKGHTQILGTLSNHDEFVDDDESIRTGSGSRTSSTAGKTNT